MAFCSSVCVCVCVCVRVQAALQQFVLPSQQHLKNQFFSSLCKKSHINNPSNPFMDNRIFFITDVSLLHFFFSCYLIWSSMTMIEVHWIHDQCVQREREGEEMEKEQPQIFLACCCDPQQNTSFVFFLLRTSMSAPGNWLMYKWRSGWGKKLVCFAGKLETVQR